MPYKNKEERRAYNKAYRESKMDGLYTVYLLPKENYVGMTTNLTFRLYDHTKKHNRNVEDVKILGKYKTRKQARAIEDSYHNKGYLGALAGYVWSKNKDRNNN
tara:strand:- start:212 stop:520 length:309 start_codon:yes stop_codon:yes gene_type:complete